MDLKICHLENIGKEKPEYAKFQVNFGFGNAGLVWFRLYLPRGN